MEVLREHEVAAVPDKTSLVSDAYPLDPPDDEGLIIVDDEAFMDEYRPPGPMEFMRAFITKKRTWILISFAILCCFFLLVVGSVVPSVVLTRPGRGNSGSVTSNYSPYSPNYSPESSLGSSNSPESSASSESSYTSQMSTYYTSQEPTIPENFEPMQIPAPPSPDDEFIRNSAEYQITYTNKDLWLYRDDMVEQFNEQCKSLNSFLNISTGLESTRIQYKLLTDGKSRCYNNREIRVREYQSGWKAGSSYVDIKSNSHDQTKACDVPFWPSDNYYNQSRSKCERDVHKCKDKFSHETRIFFDEIHTMETCYDLLQLYPWAFDKLPAEKQYHTVTVDDLNPWWTKVYLGQMDGDTNYEIAFTLRYNTLEQAEEGNIEAPSYGEWSIRIYSLDDGAQENFNQNVVDATWDMWQGLTDLFGNKDNFGC